jgi:serine/threonine kinase PknH
MSPFISGMRAVAIAALVGGYAWMCPATAIADSNSDALLGMLSKGYSPSNCKTDQVAGALAALKCGRNSLPNGPASAEYILYGNSNDVSAGFQGGSSTLALAACKPGDPSPDTWHYDSSPDTAAGQVACGTNDNVPEVVWTNYKNHMVGIIGGSDASSLYKWWEDNG